MFYKYIEFEKGQFSIGYELDDLDFFRLDTCFSREDAQLKIEALERKRQAIQKLERQRQIIRKRILKYTKQECEIMIALKKLDCASEEILMNED